MHTQRKHVTYSQRKTSFVEFYCTSLVLKVCQEIKLIIKSTFRCSVSVLEYFRALSFLNLNNRR